MPEAVRRAIRLMSADGSVAGDIETAGENADIAVSHQPLVRAPVDAGPQDVHGERRTEAVWMDADPGLPESLSQCTQKP